MSRLRIGYGEDIHRTKVGRPLILAGVKIPCSFGLDGHSDADVVYHAIADALLGAAAIGDIGQYFPSDSPDCEGMDSSIILKRCYSMVKVLRYRLVNIDVAISAEKPSLSTFVTDMRKNIAAALDINVENVGIQLMTNEGLDAVGEGKAIRATAVLLLERKIL